MGSSQVYLIGAVFLYALVQSGHALSCWKCSSDLDITCAEYLNTTQILQQRSHYRNVDYQNGQYQGGNNGINDRMPILSPCQNSFGVVYGQKHVCMKQVFNVSGGRRIVSRDCKAVSNRTLAGRCPTEITEQGYPLEFCEYCEYDGCNSATELRTNILLAVLPCAVLYFFPKVIFS